MSPCATIMTLILSVCEFLSFWRISVLIQSTNDQSFFKQFLRSQSNKIIFEVAFLIIFSRPQLCENFSVKLITPKYYDWCFGQFYQSRIEVLLSRSASFLLQLVILSQFFSYNKSFSSGHKINGSKRHFFV